MFYRERNAFVKPQGYTQFIMVENTECKHKFVCLQENSQGIFNYLNHYLII